MKRIVFLSAICLIVALSACFWLAQQAQGDVDPCTIPSGSLSCDDGNGTVLVENSNVKAAWHYNNLTSPNENQGGGNLYKLYYKPLDPGLTHNMVPETDWGTPNSTVIWAGVGGAGATSIFATDVPSTGSCADVTADWTPFIGDNNASGHLDNKTITEGSGQVTIVFVYSVTNQITGERWYQVSKTWTVNADGTLDLKLDWTLPNQGCYSEPAVRFKWDKSNGWDRWRKYGTNNYAPVAWWFPITTPYLLGSANLSRYFPSDLSACPDGALFGSTCYASFDQLNLFTPQWVSFTGSSSSDVPTLTTSKGAGMTNIPNGWAQTVEQSVAETPWDGVHMIGEYATAWTEWWGGNPAYNYRYAYLPANTTWTDELHIKYGDNYGGPDISNVSSQPTSDGAILSWTTDIPSDSRVRVLTDPATYAVSVVRDYTPVTSHSITVTGLSSNKTYSYAVVSFDSSGNKSVSTWYSFTTTS